MNDSQWIKLNVILRVILIVIMLWVLGQVVYYHYGYSDPDDQLLIDKVGNNITCKQALYYYAEKELGIFNNTNREENLKKFNISDWEINTPLINP